MIEAGGVSALKVITLLSVRLQQNRQNVSYATRICSLSGRLIIIKFNMLYVFYGVGTVIAL